MRAHNKQTKNLSTHEEYIYSYIWKNAEKYIYLFIYFILFYFYLEELSKYSKSTSTFKIYLYQLDLVTPCSKHAWAIWQSTCLDRPKSQ
jgi:hypothetical protein